MSIDATDLATRLPQAISAGSVAGRIEAGAGPPNAFVIDP